MTIDELKQIEFFSGLSDEELCFVLNLLDKQTYKSGGKIYTQGEASENLFLVKNGKVIITHKFDNDIVTVNNLESGYFFGESGIVKEKAKHKTDAIAETDGTEILKLSKNNFEKLKKENPKAALTIISKISSILSERITEDISKIAVISAISDLINKPGNLDNIYYLAREILSITIKSIPAQSAFLGIFKKHDNEKITILASVGLSPKQLPGEMPSDSDIFIEQAVHENKEVVISSAEYEKREKVFYAKKNLLSRPISIGSDIIGIITISDKSTGDFTTKNSLMLSIISSQISFAIEEARRRKEKSDQEELRRRYIGI